MSRTVILGIKPGPMGAGPVLRSAGAGRGSGSAGAWGHRGQSGIGVVLVLGLQESQVFISFSFSHWEGVSLHTGLPGVGERVTEIM